jgi:hypothetical protein
MCLEDAIPKCWWLVTKLTHILQENEFSEILYNSQYISKSFIKMLNHLPAKIFKISSYVKQSYPSTVFEKICLNFFFFNSFKLY